MTNHKSDWLGVLSKAFQVFKTIVDAIWALDGSDEDISRLESLAPQIARLTIGAGLKDRQPITKPKGETVIELGWIEVNPRESFEERKARNGFNHVEPIVRAETSKLSGKVRRRIVMYHDKSRDSSESMLSRIRVQGHRPAGLNDLFEVHAQFRDLCKGWSIIFLDINSVCLDEIGREHAPILISARYPNEYGKQFIFNLGTQPLYEVHLGNFAFAAIAEEYPVVE